MSMYYGKNAKPPKKKGELAISIGHDMKWFQKLEVDIGIKREDIGYITWHGPDKEDSGEWREDE